MDLSTDAVRRELDDIARHNDRALTLHREAMTRMVESRELDGAQTDELVTGGLARRRFLVVGGVAVATSAILAACGGSSPSSSPSTGSTASTSGGPTSQGGGLGTGSSAMDVVLLRTASSLENLAVSTYQRLLATKLITNPSVVAAANTFMEQHAQHASAFEAQTTNAGGQPFTVANPVIDAQVIAPALAKAKTQLAAIQLAYTLETAAGETYQSTIGSFSRAAYNSAAGAILGVESRHVALLGIVLQSLGQPATTYPSYPQNGFQTDTKAVKAGTGVSTSSTGSGGS